jgi:hypothetical protein
MADTIIEKIEESENTAPGFREIIESKHVKFSKPVSFEGKEYTEIDLNCLEDLSAKQLMKIARVFPVTLEMPETDPEYCAYVAAEAAGMPVEFFSSLGARDMMRIKYIVQSFFLRA